MVEALSDSNSSVRFNALMALGERLTPELLPVIESLLGDNDEYVRQTAVEYYGRLARDVGSFPTRRSSDLSNSSVRFNALMALGERLTPELLPVIESLLGDN